MSPSVEVVLMDTDGELMKTEVGVLEFVCGAKLQLSDKRASIAHSNSLENIWRTSPSPTEVCWDAGLYMSPKNISTYSTVDTSWYLTGNWS